MRGCRLLLAIVVASLAGEGSFYVSACSSESNLVGNGACDGYCAKVAAANCKVAASQDQCLAKCLFYETDPTASRDPTDPQACSDANSRMIRCATLDGNVGCDGGTGRAHVVGCDPIVADRSGACRFWTSDAGIDESGP